MSKEKKTEEKAIDPTDLIMTPVSINEPPGSTVDRPPPEIEPPDVEEPPEEDDPLPSEADLWKMTKHDLFELAAERGVETDHASNKEEVIHALIRAEKKNKRS